jgi:uncharacterized phage protein (TIGR01671 family)
MKRWLCEDSQYLQMDGKKVHAAPWSTMEWDIPSEEYIIQQCTGIKDSERIDIYEGDIIEFERNDKKCIANIFYHDAFVVTGNSEEGTFVYAYLHDLVNYVYKMKIKVIGNVFENSELLNK